VPTQNPINMAWKLIPKDFDTSVKKDYSETNISLHVT